MPGGASPIEPQGDRQNSPSGTRKRRSTSRFIEDDDDEPVQHVGSPVSTMHLSAGECPYVRPKEPSSKVTSFFSEG